MKTTGTAPPPASVVHKVDVELLRAGDVLLTRSPGQPASELIQKVTGSLFSHAILILDPPYAIESTRYGVVRFQIDRLVFNNSSNGLLLRSRSQNDGCFNIDSLLLFAEGRVSTPYASTEVLLSLFRSLPRVERGTYFCSHLVAEAYAQAGFGLIDELTPERVTPAALAKSPLFEHIETFTYPVSTELLPFDHAYFDAPSEASFAQQESMRKQEIVDSVKKTYPQLADRFASFNDMIVYLSKLLNSNEKEAFALDGVIAKAIVDSKLHLLARDLMPPDSDTFFTDFYLRGALVYGTLSVEQKYSLRNFYRQMGARTDATMTDRQRDVDAFRKAYMQSELESVRLVLAIAEDSKAIHARVSLVVKTCLQLVEAAFPTGDA